jgi:hypothetical protein
MIAAVASDRSSASVARIDVRLPIEADRDRFVDLFRDEAFMVFSGGALREIEAHASFERMLLDAGNCPSDSGSGQSWMTALATCTAFEPADWSRYAGWAPR